MWPKERSDSTEIALTERSQRRLLSQKDLTLETSHDIALSEETASRRASELPYREPPYGISSPGGSPKTNKQPFRNTKSGNAGYVDAEFSEHTKC